jgi:hydrogenase expression/formation protein HypE
MSNERITLAHGAGGESMRRLIRELFRDTFDSPELRPLADAALLDLASSRVAFTTDGYTVKPIFFPGGNIGNLCIAGTVNDLAVMGARPVCLSFSCIIEEGLPLEVLEKIIQSAAAEARRANVNIVTGDTKVVARGECDELFITTSGIGVRPFAKGISAEGITPGDAILINGYVGDHGISVLAARGNFSMKVDAESDCAPLNGLIERVLTESSGVKWMRDATRGGLAAVLTELAEDTPCGIMINESSVPVRESVQAVCELLGFDPLHIANEGKVVMVVDQAEAEKILAAMKCDPLGANAVCIGEITKDASGAVRLKTPVGTIRRLHRPAGELLPRIC